ncbi:uncharacterized protein GGS22DRAFT_198674 [Annulohypoxylon maeteangense]|uniref:uncharacterized protein n=1 Tax=Annulohypoxylon maeteangense TaxID=1927788 RepID=UPI002007BBEA|nr:uncharacterized protein GGS22DRAFT_198674 [Annulohypoxylon maeteangense]KAI0887337.1 hypothetical protein GGS22DRAFT_198674 [Annulohypoxylon maeteangense]
MAVHGKSSAVTAECTQVFHLFTRLPIELRSKIWACNLPGPRIVEIKCSAEPARTSQLRQGDRRAVVCTSTSPIPINLHICRESRWEALKRYRLLFGSSPQLGRIFFDPLEDTLYFGPRRGIATAETLFHTFVSLVQREDLGQVRRIAISEGLITYTGSGSRRGRANKLTFKQTLCQAQRYFINIEHLTFVSDDRNPVYSSDAVFVEPRVRNRILERRIQEAIDVVEGQQPEFKLPLCSVRVIAAEPNRPLYNQSVMGYNGKRATFFKEIQLPRIQRDMAHLQSATCV